MGKPGKVIAASDLSELSDQVAERAARIAGRLGIQAQLLHVLDTNTLDAVRHWLDGGSDAVEKLIIQATSALQDQCERIAGKTGHALTPVVQEGNVLDTILASATDEALLVLGVRGRLALRDLVLGTTARHLLYKHQGPVLVVKNRAEQDYEHIMVTTDFSDHAFRALQRAAELFPESHIHVVHVIPNLLGQQMRFTSVDEQVIREYREKSRTRAEIDMTQLLARAGLDPDRVTPRIDTGEATHVLPELAEKLGVDLLVAGKQGHSALGDRLLGSVSQRLLQDCPIDVLVECQSH